MSVKYAVSKAYASNGQVTTLFIFKTLRCAKFLLKKRAASGEMAAKERRLLC